MDQRKLFRRLLAFACAALCLFSATAVKAVSAEAEKPPVKTIQSYSFREDSVCAETESEAAPTLPRQKALRALNASPSVEAKVSSLAAQCRSSASTAYEQALWLHDWLCMNADYDTTYSEYGADGVLLRGTGVCQSYTEAYSLLLDALGIENMLIKSYSMNHAWNLVKIDGVWCHVDCTWDDPVPGGMENHLYFGMSDALMERDHVWEKGDYPVCNSLQNYYPVRAGMHCFDSAETLFTALDLLAEAGEESIELYYTGTDAEFQVIDALRSWFSGHSGSYGVRGYSLQYTDYYYSLHLLYSGGSKPPVSADPQYRVDPPVKAPALELNGPESSYPLAEYAKNGLLLVFGRESCGNTLSLLSRLGQQLPKLQAKGIQLLSSIEGISGEADIARITADYGDLHYAYYDNYTMWNYIHAVDSDLHSITFPCVFVVNAQQQIVYFSSGYVSDINALIQEALRVAAATDDTLIRGYIRRMYSVCLGREPGADEIAYYLWEINDNGMTGTEAAQKFIFSDEFLTKNYCDRHYAEALYEAFMGRAPSEEEINSKAYLLQQGQTREQVFNEFVTSSEYKSICAAAGIVPGSAISYSGKGTRAGGRCTVYGCESAKGMDAFNARLYTAVLDRSPARNELDAWTYYLIHGDHSAKSTAKYFLFSEEFLAHGYDDAAFVGYLYEAMMGRTPGTDELAYWVWRMSEGLSREAAFDEFAATDEFKLICQSYGIVCE